jgi:hypothetical protein
MKVITYGIQPKPKPPPNFPEMLADEIMRRHSGWVLVEACRIIAQRLVPEVPQSETSAPPEKTSDAVLPVLVGTDTMSVRKRRRGRPRGRGIPKGHIKVMVRAIQREKCKAFDEGRELLETNVINAFRMKLPNADASRVFELVRSEWQRAVDGRLRIQALTSAIGGRSAAGSQDEAAQNPKVMTADGQ